MDGVSNKNRIIYGAFFVRCSLTSRLIRNPKGLLGRRYAAPIISTLGLIVNRMLSPYVRLSLVLLLLACTAASLNFMYQAGCAGDLKGGSLGDPNLALKIEGKGVVLGWLSVLLLSVIIGTLPRLQAGLRIVGVTVALVIGFITITIIGIKFEVWGIQSCFQ